MPDFDFMTVEKVAEGLGLSTRAVHYGIERGEFPGARKVDPTGETSPWVIPVAAYELALKARKKRKAAPLKQPAK